MPWWEKKEPGRLGLCWQESSWHHISSTCLVCPWLLVDPSSHQSNQTDRHVTLNAQTPMEPSCCVWETQACITQLIVSLPAFLVHIATGTECAFTHINITHPNTHKVLYHPCQPPFESGQDSHPSMQAEKAWDFSQSLGPVILLSLTSRQISSADQWYPPGTLCTGYQVGFPYFSLDSHFFFSSAVFHVLALAFNYL